MIVETDSIIVNRKGSLIQVKIQKQNYYATNRSEADALHFIVRI